MLTHPNRCTPTLCLIRSRVISASASAVPFPITLTPKSRRRQTTIMSTGYDSTAEVTANGSNNAANASAIHMFANSNKDVSTYSSRYV